MGSLWKKVLYQVLILAVCAWLIYPPQEKIKYGKDLAGGTSLIYTVQVGPTEDPRQVIPKVIEALKDRIDPQGVLEISINSLGNDRLEITMPLPREEVKVLRAKFEEALAEIGRFKLSSARLNQVFGRSGASPGSIPTAAM